MPTLVPRPPLPTLFRVWLALGAQSFGGGSATLALIRRELVERRGWVGDSEFTRDWGLCQAAPGVNLLALTILIGWRLGGTPGVALALTGLLAPSVGITLLITACYAHFQGLPAVRNAVRGVIPATVGVGLMTAWQMAVPLLRESKREGRASLAVAVALLVGSGVTIALAGPPVVAILCAAGMVGAGANWLRDAAARRRTP